MDAGFFEGSEKLACWRRFMARGLEVCVSLVNCMEYSKVGVFERLDTDVRQAVNAGSGKNPPMPAILSTGFSKANED